RRACKIQGAFGKDRIVRKEEDSGVYRVWAGPEGKGQAGRDDLRVSRREIETFLMGAVRKRQKLDSLQRAAIYANSKQTGIALGAGENVDSHHFLVPSHRTRRLSIFVHEKEVHDPHPAVPASFGACGLLEFRSVDV